MAEETGFSVGCETDQGSIIRVSDTSLLNSLQEMRSSRNWWRLAAIWSIMGLIIMLIALLRMRG
jgi:hypothetical protein